VHFFNEERRYARGLPFYWAHYPDLTATVPLDATPNYLPTVHAPARIKAAFPGAQYMRFVVLLRDPISRAQSHFAHARELVVAVQKRQLAPGVHKWAFALAFNQSFEQQLARAQAAFEACLSGFFGDGRAGWAQLPPAIIWQHCGATKNASLFSFGLYSSQLAWWQRHFPRPDAFCLVSSNHFRNNTDAVLSTVSAFLGLPKFDSMRPRYFLENNRARKYVCYMILLIVDNTCM
jgi:hypothetical protein